MLECALRKLPCSCLKLPVLEISPAHLHPVSSLGCAFVFICFKKTPNTLPQPAEAKLPQNCCFNSAGNEESVFS